MFMDKHSVAKVSLELIPLPPPPLFMNYAQAQFIVVS